MKYLFVPLMLVLFTGSLLADTAPADVPSTITAVRVYRSGAQVYRSGEGTVPAGQSILKFVGLSPTLDPSSVQFSADGAFTILSVNFQRNYINPLENNPEVKELEAGIKRLREEDQKLAIDLQVLEEEAALLIANRQIGGQQNGVQLADLQAVAEYYRIRLKAIKLEQFSIGSDRKEMEEEIQKLQQQLSEITARMGRKASGEIWVKVTAERPAEGAFTLSYLVPGAGWRPNYDVRVEEVGQDVVLDLKGDVYQSSGEDWNGVDLTLSTGRPTDSGLKPDLQPWWLAPYQPVAYQSGERPRRLEAYSYNKAMPAEMDEAAGAPPPPPPPPAEYAAVEQVERTTTREYQISLPYDVPSDGKQYTVQIANYELPADYQYYVAPKLNTDVFLTAKVVGWDEYQLLSGPANLFFEGRFLGATRLEVAQTSDTLELSLGKDKGIVVTRTKDEQFKDKQFIGNKVTQTIGWKIELRNSKRRPVAILVEDQYPISTTDEIEVKLDDARGARVDKEEGKLHWEVQLEPGRAQTLHFGYEVKYPKRMRLLLE